MKKSISFFDFDGVLYKGADDEEPYTVYGFMRYLVREGVVQIAKFAQLQEHFIAYEAGVVDRRQMAHAVIDQYAKSIAGHSRTEIADAAWRFWNRPDVKLWFGYAAELVELLREYTRPVLISGSSAETLFPVLGSLGFDSNSVYATECLSSGGVFTGEWKELATAEAKEQLIRSLKGWYFSGMVSFAFGDSSSDVPMLDAVNPKNAYLLGEPSESLRQLAEVKGWTVIPYDADVISIVRKRLEVVFG